MDGSSDDCPIMRDALPELALGLADGRQRALALEHVARCSDCRHELEQLTSLADELIALAPQQEPPPGFENRVLRQTKPHRPRRRLRHLALVAVVPAIAAATALGIHISYGSDLTLASQYRAALRDAHGTYFQSTRLRTPNGQPAGILYAYQGSPSWLFYTLNGRSGWGRYAMRVVTRVGSTFSLPVPTLVNRSWGASTPIPVRDIARVKLVRRSDGRTLTAALPKIDP